MSNLPIVLSENCRVEGSKTPGRRRRRPEVQRRNRDDSGGKLSALHWDDLQRPSRESRNLPAGIGILQQRPQIAGQRGFSRREGEQQRQRERQEQKVEKEQP